MKTVTMICYNRPAYFLRALEALLTNAELCHFDAIHVFAEPTTVLEMNNILSELSLGSHPLCAQLSCPILIHQNPEKHGTDRNGYRALSFVFESLGSSINLHVEDDVIVSPDAAHIALWYEKQPENPDRMCLCLHNHSGEEVSANRNNLSFTKDVHDFNAYGWAATATNWRQWLQKEWFTNRWSLDGKVRFGWDWSLNYHCACTKQAHVLMPVVSRATTIGEYNGVNMTPEFWRAEFGEQKIFLG